MSIANALNNAISGLTAASRGTEVVSSNLANALTPGYARRELDLSPRIHSGNGGGVHVDGVSRIISNTVLADYRNASAALGRSSVTADFYTKLETAIGQPQDGQSLSAMMTEVETALISASSRPDSDVRLRAVFESASQLVKKINSISISIQDARTNADKQIDKQVDTLNTDLNEVARLNRQIIVEQANGRNSSSLEDARRAVVDRISAIIPVREVPRENGRVALFTQNGGALLDGKSPTAISFDPTGLMTPDIGQSSVQLGRLTINGIVATETDMGLFSGGSLSEHFKLRDEYAVDAQGGIDAVARELYGRFASPTTDPSISAGMAGLFTDAGGVFDPANEHGLALRIRVNAAVDEAQGGELRRLRDGIYAASSVDVGDGTLLNAMQQAMTSSREYSSDHASSGAGSVAALASAFLSDMSSRRLTTETTQAHDVTLQASLRDALLADGVDSDSEMQMLLQLEKAYAANAKVIQAVDEMLDQILRI